MNITNSSRLAEAKDELQYVFKHLYVSHQRLVGVYRHFQHNLGHIAPLR